MENFSYFNPNNPTQGVHVAGKKEDRHIDLRMFIATDMLKSGLFRDLEQFGAEAIDIFEPWIISSFFFHLRPRVRLGRGEIRDKVEERKHRSGAENVKKRGRLDGGGKSEDEVLL